MTRGSVFRGNTAFRNFWTASMISEIGTEFSYIAVPLVAVLTLDAGPAEMGLLLAAVTAPSLFFSIGFGSWIDRRGRRRELLIASDIVSAALLVSIPIAYWLDVLTFAQLCVVGFLAGTMGVIWDVTFGVMIVSIVARERLVWANQLTNGSSAAAGLLGSGLGGVLVQILTAPVAVALDGMSYLASALFLRRTEAEEPPGYDSGRGHWRAGFAFIRREPIVRASLAALATINFFTFGFFAIFLLYATRSLDIGAATLGLILAAGSLGAVGGAVVAGTLNRRIGIGPTFALGSLLYPALLVLVPAAGGSHTLVVGTLVVAMLGSGFGVAIQDVAENSISLALVPDAVRSRVAGAFSVVNYGVRPLGAILGGLLAAEIGLREAAWILTLCGPVGVVFLLASPVIRLWDLPEPAPLSPEVAK